MVANNETSVAVDLIDLIGTLFAHEEKISRSGQRPWERGHHR